MATAGMTELDASIVKCTYEDDTIPKEKHVLSLIKLSDYTTGFLNNLFRRFSTRNYRVIFKTLLVLHRLTKDGSIGVMRSLETKLGYLQSVFTFNVRDSPVHSRLIRQYSAYLNEKGTFFKNHAISPERDTPTDAKAWALKLDNDQRFQMLPALQLQLDKLLIVDPAVHFLDGNIRYLFTLLQRDAIRLYSVCSVMIYASLDHVETLSREQTAIFLQCCRNSLSLDDRLLQWHDSLVKHRLTRDDTIPTFQKIPHNFIDTLEMQLEHLDQEAGMAPGDGYKLSFGVAISSTRRDAERQQTPRSNRSISKTDLNKSPFYNDTLMETNFSPKNNNGQQQQQQPSGFGSGFGSGQTYKKPVPAQGQQPHAQQQQQQYANANTTTTNKNNNNNNFDEDEFAVFDTWGDNDEWGQIASSSAAVTSTPQQQQQQQHYHPQQQQQPQKQPPTQASSDFDPFAIIAAQASPTAAQNPPPQSPPLPQQPTQPLPPPPHAVQTPAQWTNNPFDMNPAAAARAPSANANAAPYSSPQQSTPLPYQPQQQQFSPSYPPPQQQQQQFYGFDIIGQQSPQQQQYVQPYQPNPAQFQPTSPMNGGYPPQQGQGMPAFSYQNPTQQSTMNYGYQQPGPYQPF